MKVENPFEGKYKFEQFEFQGKTAFVVFPPEGTANGKWALKTEYFSAFPALEMHMLDKGYHIACVFNRGRWFAMDDVEHQASFIKYVSRKYQLYSKCVPIGLSAGGGMALMIAGTHPELVGALYIDAGVYNLFSTPYSYGKSTILDDPYDVIGEITKYYGKSPSEMLAYRNAPIDYEDAIIGSRIPAVFVYGTADLIVPFDENCGILLEKYKENGIENIVFKKEGCKHHPHGVEDHDAVIDFLNRYMK